MILGADKFVIFYETKLDSKKYINIIFQENDEPLEPDELPEHLRPSPKIDLSKVIDFLRLH